MKCPTGSVYNQSITSSTSGSKSNTPSRPNWDFDDEFDGGEETCGRVIVNLYLYIRDQEPGHTILVISRDLGAPMEFPAWCRLTKNQLVEMQHPYYLITLKPHLIGKEHV